MADTGTDPITQYEEQEFVAEEQDRLHDLEQPTHPATGTSSAASPLLSEFPNPDTPPRLPWYKRPSPIWIYVPHFLSCLALGMTLAPKVQFLTLLICWEHFAEEMVPDGAGTSGLPSVFSSGGSTDPYIRCSKNSEVQKAASQLELAIMLVLNILGALTAAHLGAFSDRHGRKIVIFICMAGSMLDDFTFLFTNYAYRIVTSKFLIIGAIMKGLVGGMAGPNATVHAYIADCSSAADRAMLFGILTASLFGGLAIGPLIGGWIIKWSGQVITVFYISAAVHAFYALLAAIAIPESLPEEKRSHIKFMSGQDDQAQQPTTTRSRRFLSNVFNIKQIFAPLAIFAPRPARMLQGIEGGQPPRKESTLLRWNLTLVAVCFGCMILAFGVFPVLIRYPGYRFGWGAVENGNFLSLIGFSRTIVYLVLLPTVVKSFNFFAERKRTKAHERDTTIAEEENRPAPPTPEIKRHSQTLDIWLVRVSLAVDAVAYFFMAMAINTAQYMGAAVFAALGGAAMPAMQSLFTTLVDPHQTGAILASVAVLQSTIGIVAPLISVSIFSATVTSFPQAIFYYTAGILGSAAIVSFFIRANSRKNPPPSRFNQQELATESTPLLAEQSLRK